MEDEIAISQEARQRYIERRTKDIENLRAALRSQSFDEFKRLGHQIKGNAASFGYSDLEKIAVLLEAAGEMQDFAEASRHLGAFEKWLEQQHA